MSESATTERDREQLPAVVTEETTPAAQPAAPTTIPDDPDDRALFEARAELQRAEAGTEGGEQQQQQASPAPAQPTPTPTPAPQQPAARQPVVPAGVLAEERRKSRALADEVLYLKGALAARTQQQPDATTQPGGGGQQQQPTAAEAIQAEGTRIIAAAKQFDQGDLSMEQYKLIELQAEDRIAALRAQHLIAHVQSTQPAGNTVGIADAHVLEQHLERMSQEHPWSALLNDQEIDWLAAVARDEFRGRGQPITSGNHVDTLRLRQRVAELSDTFGPQWYPNHQIVQPPTNAQPQQGVTRTPAAGNQQRVQQVARLATVANNQPPSLSQAGHADTGDAAMTSDKIGTMTEDEILALPRAVRDRFLHQGA